MDDKFRNKYRIETTRLRHWDYGWNGFYFVTICTKNREIFFGEICKGVMELSELGEIAKKYWLEIPKHFPFVTLESFIVMPNHIHGIIIIDKKNDGRDVLVETQEDYDRGFLVETQNVASLPKNKFGPQSKNLASIIRGFKIGVTKNAKRLNPDFNWQPRFYDHIIRNENSFNNISNYIKQNPERWEHDKNYGKSI